LFFENRLTLKVFQKFSVFQNALASLVQQKITIRILCEKEAAKKRFFDYFVFDFFLLFFQIFKLNYVHQKEIYFKRKKNKLSCYFVGVGESRSFI